MNRNKHIQYLGLRVMVYGCVQTVVQPPIDKDGVQGKPAWFDIGRLEIESTEPVMERPNFDEGAQAEGRKGPAEKP